MYFTRDIRTFSTSALAIFPVSLSLVFMCKVLIFMKSDLLTLGKIFFCSYAQTTLHFLPMSFPLLSVTFSWSNKGIFMNPFSFFSELFNWLQVNFCWSNRIEGDHKWLSTLCCHPLSFSPDSKALRILWKYLRGHWRYSTKMCDW